MQKLLLLLKCPICDKICNNPEQLRVHRIDSHKGIYQACYLKSKVEFLPQWQ